MTIHHHESDASGSWLAANFMMLLTILVIAAIVIGGVFLFRALDEDSGGGIDVDITDGTGGGGDTGGGDNSGQTGRWIPSGTVIEVVAA